MSAQAQKLTANPTVASASINQARPGGVVATAGGGAVSAWLLMIAPR
jgi:hypothetical protein